MLRVLVSLLFMARLFRCGLLHAVVCCRLNDFEIVPGLSFRCADARFVDSYLFCVVPERILQPLCYETQAVRLFHRPAKKT